MKLKFVLAIAALSLAPVLAHAAPFTYNVDYNFGTFTVNGTITTDTSSGVLSTGDILDWSLLLNDGSQILDLLGPLSGNNSQTEIVGGDAVASPTAITYNFDDPNFNAFIFQSPSVGVGDNYLCYQGVGGGCNDFNGAHIAINIDGDAVFEHSESGVTVIATASAVPESSSLALMGSGILGLAGVLRRKINL